MFNLGGNLSIFTHNPSAKSLTAAAPDVGKNVTLESEMQASLENSPAHAKTELQRLRKLPRERSRFHPSSLAMEMTENRCAGARAEIINRAKLSELSGVKHKHA